LKDDSGGKREAEGWIGRVIGTLVADVDDVVKIGARRHRLGLGYGYLDGGAGYLSGCLNWGEDKKAGDRQGHRESEH
jgi:hypothetical protein